MISSYMGIDFSDAVQLIESRLKSYKPIRIQHNKAIRAAVMILFLEVNNTPHILFTKRTDKVEHHKGQISFPGGVFDPGDKSLLQTGLRETYEEIGIPPEQIRLLGESDEFFTVTKFLIRPFAAVLNPPLNYRLNRDEVAELIHVPLWLFLTDQYFEVKKWDYHGKKYDVYFYYYDRHIIWGATAFILNRFIHLVFDYNPAPKPVYRDPGEIKILK